MLAPMKNINNIPPGQKLLVQGTTLKTPERQSRESLEDNKNHNPGSKTEMSGSDCGESTLPPSSPKESNTFPAFKNVEEQQTAALWLIWLQTFRSLAGQNMHKDLRFLEVVSPGFSTVARCLLVLILFLIVAAVAAAVPVKPMRIIVAVFGVLMTIILCILLVQDYSRDMQQFYRPNLGNTITVVLLTIPLFASLFCATWYPKLRRDVLVTTMDSVESVRFPSVAIFQRRDWSSQANLLSGYSTCYLGWHNDTAPACSSLPEGSLGNSQSCKCEELWYNNDQVIEEFIWQNISYRYLAFESAPWMVSSTPTYLMLLQAFYNYNSTDVMSDVIMVNPTLMVALYDPQLGMQEAFDKGYTAMNLVNANGIVSINVGLVLQQPENSAPAYSYELSLSSSPCTSLVCNSNDALWLACHMSLYIQVPKFYRTIISTEKENSWGDVVSSAGSFFSFVQFLSWILSAQAFTS